MRRPVAGQPTIRRSISSEYFLGFPFAKKAKTANKRPIIALVERGGEIRTFHTTFVDKETITKIVAENVAKESRLHTNESRLYNDAHKIVAAHEKVKHLAGEYARREVEWNDDETDATIRKVHTNNAVGSTVQCLGLFSAFPERA